MESLYFLVPCALIFIGLAIKVLFWAINNGQYDNLDTEAHRILFDAQKSGQASKQATTSSSEDSIQESDTKNP
ncbi:MAG: cytochrome oxidase maturation protein, cbb3-type [Cellvibrio sp. 79]|nr:MAG: cytochrome oxidase maturation protein, cbb3-type [Cellvibrio sp. 79]